MGRHTSAVCRLCRREGTKLYLKGARCHTKKCAVEKRDTPPGMHNWRKSKLSEYGQRLREKQKVKRYYGIFETQFRQYFSIAQKSPSNTGEALLIALERRLDSVLCRAKLAYSRKMARQMVRHGHILVNKKKVTIPSYAVNVGDIIEAVNHEGSKKLVQTPFEHSIAPEIPSWLEVTKEPVTAKVVQLPTRNEIQISIREQMVVEFCSR